MHIHHFCTEPFVSPNRAVRFAYAKYNIIIYLRYSFVKSVGIKNAFFSQYYQINRAFLLLLCHFYLFFLFGRRFPHINVEIEVHALRFYRNIAFYIFAVRVSLVTERQKIFFNGI